LLPFGITRTFTLSADTIVPGPQMHKGAQTAQPSIANGDQVVVVTFNADTTAKAVIKCSADGFPTGGFGPPPWVRSMWFHQ
jgi:hypothetical protein